MEPWFGNHGNATREAKREILTSLQWSRGSVTTETPLACLGRADTHVASMEPWFGNHGNVRRDKQAPGESEASMEPWFGNHGNDRLVLAAAAPQQASMEPWFGNHGNQRSRLAETRDEPASMEPWFGNHGNGDSVMSTDWLNHPLQWSRGSVTTETSAGRSMSWSG